MHFWNIRIVKIVRNIRNAMHGGATKLLQGGRLLILRDGKTYTVQGWEVR